MCEVEKSIIDRNLVTVVDWIKVAWEVVTFYWCIKIDDEILLAVWLLVR